MYIFIGPNYKNPMFETRYMGIVLRKNKKTTLTRQVSSMIHSARPTVSPLVNIALAWNLFCFENCGRVMRKNNDQYRPGVWVGLADQFVGRKMLG